jgi:glyoxylase-like metal-dependent hydrolase (beta-lactamase superfamily II)
VDEYRGLRLCARDVGGLAGAEGTAATPHFQRHGLADPGDGRHAAGAQYVLQDLVPSVPRAYHRMQDGHAVRIGGRDWEIITGFGHSPEHVSLYCRRSMC